MNRKLKKWKQQGEDWFEVLNAWSWLAKMLAWTFRRLIYVVGMVMGVNITGAIVDKQDMYQKIIEWLVQFAGG